VNFVVNRRFFDGGLASSRQLFSASLTGGKGMARASSARSFRPLTWAEEALS